MPGDFSPSTTAKSVNASLGRRWGARSSVDTHHMKAAAIQLEPAIGDVEANLTLATRTDTPTSDDQRAGVRQPGVARIKPPPRVSGTSAQEFPNRCITLHIRAYC